MSRGVRAWAKAAMGRLKPAPTLSHRSCLRVTGMGMGISVHNFDASRCALGSAGAAGQNDSLYSLLMSRLYAGVDLGGTSFIAVIANRKGKVLGSSDGPTTRGAKAEETIEQIADHIREAAKEASVKMSKIRAIGIGAAGAVDPERGVVVRAPNLGWSNVPVARDLRKKLGPDVVLGNDVQVAIIGEHSYGAAKGTRRAVGIWIGTGIGGGLIVDGRIDRGFSRRSRRD